MAFAVSCNQNQAAAPAAAAASEDSTAVAGSIVFFNMDKVMEGYDMANDLNSVFETKTSGIQAEIDRRGKKLEKDMTDFQNKVDKGLLTTSVAQAQYQKIQQQQQDYQQYVVRKQQEMTSLPALTPHISRPKRQPRSSAYSGTFKLLPFKGRHFPVQRCTAGGAGKMS